MLKDNKKGNAGQPVWKGILSETKRWLNNTSVDSSPVEKVMTANTSEEFKHPLKDVIHSVFQLVKTDWDKFTKRAKKWFLDECMPSLIYAAKVVIKDWKESSKLYM